MLFKNGERIDLKSGSEDAKRFKKASKEIEDTYGFPVVFKRNDSYVTTDEDSLGKVHIITPAFFIPNVCYKSNEIGETDEWRWSPTVPRKRDGEYVFTREHSRTMLDKSVFTLDKKDLDKIYFFLYLNEQFKRYYTVDSAKADANARMESKIKEAKINNIFWGERSILRSDEARLRTVARAWNLRNIENKTKAQVLEELETAVREQDERGVRSIDDFLKATQLDEETEVGALVQKAEDLNLIIFDEKTSAWYYHNHDGSFGNRIVEVPRMEKDHKYEKLKDFIFVESDHISKLRSFVNANDVPSDIKLNFDDLEHEPWDKIREWCNLNEVELTARGRTKDKVFADILKKREQL